MSHFSRRAFIKNGLAIATLYRLQQIESLANSPLVMTVRGAISPSQLGTTLVHEHVLVDFIGADKVSPSRYNQEEAFETALPVLKDLKKRGCTTMIECTPAYLGRDVGLLKRLSEATE